MISKEYPTVLARSADKEALVSAHSTVITEDEARTVIYSYADEFEISDLVFSGGTYYGRSCAYPAKGRVELVDKPLTLGATLHELAHIIVFNDTGECEIKGDGKRDVHSDRFVEVLDGLVRSERLWRGLGKNRNFECSV